MVSYMVSTIFYQIPVVKSLAFAWGVSKQGKRDIPGCFSSVSFVGFRFACGGCELQVGLYLIICAGLSLRVLSWDVRFRMWELCAARFACGGFGGSFGVLLLHACSMLHGSFSEVRLRPDPANLVTCNQVSFLKEALSFWLEPVFCIFARGCPED